MPRSQNRVQLADGHERSLGLQSPEQFSYNANMADAAPNPRWYRLTPDRIVIGLLAVECLLWMSEPFQWFSFNLHKGWTVLIAVAVVGVAFLFMLLWFAVALVLRWRFQFSIRSLLVMVVVVALPSGWLAVEMKAAREQRETVVTIENLEVNAYYDWQYDEGDTFLSNAQPPVSGWLRKELGIDFFSSVVRVSFSSIFFVSSETGGVTD